MITAKEARKNYLECIIRERLSPAGLQAFYRIQANIDFYSSTQDFLDRPFHQCGMPKIDKDQKKIVLNILEEQMGFEITESHGQITTYKISW